ncbi:hypothetical protein [Enterocloster citroniae]
MDAGMLEDYIIAEDDIPRDGRIYPEYTATMFIVIECYYNSIAKGYLQTFYQEQPFPFFGLDNMLIQLERIMDMAGVPSKCNEYRHMVNISSARKTKKIYHTWNLIKNFSLLNSIPTTYARPNIFFPSEYIPGGTQVFRAY